MKESLYLLSFVILVTAFSCCSATKSNIKLNQNPPFKILKANYNTWVGGQPGVKGYTVQFEIDNSSTVLDSVFFRNMTAKLKKDSSTTNNIYIGTFILPNRMKHYKLHRDSKKEFGNEVPDILEKIPFQLTETEAVISYIINNKKAYYKITNVVKVKRS